MSKITASPQKIPINLKSLSNSMDKRKIVKITIRLELNNENQFTSNSQYPEL